MQTKHRFDNCERMKMNKKAITAGHVLCFIGLGIVLSAVLFYGILRGVFEYTYYRDYKAIRQVKLRHIYARENDRIKMEFPVRFVPRMHDGGVRQKLLVQAEGRRCFMILRFDDGRIQLMAVPIRRQFGMGMMWAYYEVPDAAAREKIRTLLDARGEAEDGNSGSER